MQHPSLEIIENPECGVNCDKVGYIVFDHANGDYYSGIEHSSMSKAIVEQSEILNKYSKISFCPDCGKLNALRGHQDCQFPG